LQLAPYCPNLQKKIHIHKDARPFTSPPCKNLDQKLEGFYICDCGGFINKNGEHINPIPPPPEPYRPPITICCECGRPTHREILGVYVCDSCYSYIPPYGNKYKKR